MHRLIAFITLFGLLNTAALFPKYHLGKSHTCVSGPGVSKHDTCDQPDSLVELLLEKVMQMTDEVPDVRHPNPTIHLYRLFLYKFNFTGHLLFQFPEMRDWRLLQTSFITYPDRIVFLPEYYSFLFRLTPF